jgi:hypothetical protein
MRVPAGWMTCGPTRASGWRRMGQRYRAGAITKAEEDKPVTQRWGGSRGGGGWATAIGAEEDGLVTPHRGGSEGRGGRVVTAGVKSSRAVAVGCKRVTVDVENNRAVVFRRRRGATGGRVGWGGGGNSRSGRTSGRERECGRTRDRARAHGGYVPTFRRLPVS